MQPTSYPGPGTASAAAAAAPEVAAPHSRAVQEAPMSTEERAHAIALRARVYCETPRTFVGMIAAMQVKVGSYLGSHQVAQLSRLSRSFRTCDTFWEGWSRVRFEKVQRGNGRAAARAYHIRLVACVGKALRTNYNPEDAPSIPQLMDKVRNKIFRATPLFIEADLTECALILLKKEDYVGEEVLKSALKRGNRVLIDAIIDRLGLAGDVQRSDCVRAALEEGRIDLALRILRKGPIWEYGCETIFDKHMAALAAHEDSDQVREALELLLRDHKPEQHGGSMAHDKAIEAFALSPHTQALEILFKTYPEPAFPATVLLKLATQIVRDRRWLANLQSLLVRGPVDREMVGELLIQTLLAAPIQLQELRITAALPAVQQLMPHLLLTLQKWRVAYRLMDSALKGLNPAFPTASLANLGLARARAGQLMTGSTAEAEAEKIEDLFLQIDGGLRNRPREAPDRNLDHHVVESELLTTMQFLTKFASDRNLTITAKVLDAAFEMAVNKGYLRAAEALLRPGIERAALMRTLHRLGASTQAPLFIRIFHEARPNLAEWKQLFEVSSGEIREFLETHKPTS